MAAQAARWRRINDYLLEVGGKRDPRALCETALASIASLVPYDAAILYLLDDEGICDSFLVNVDRKWSDAYIGHFSRIDRGRYSFESAGEGTAEWAAAPDGEFVSDFIRPQRFERSATLQFAGDDRRLRACASLHRTGRARFTEAEIGSMRIVKPHLANLYSNLSQSRAARKPRSSSPLSRREGEIADLLCEGVGPARIGSRLCISPRTVDKHIESIHRKLGVSSRQELLVRLLSGR
jgi:DNA-binding CsgD family transcriptional regulator